MEALNAKLDAYLENPQDSLDLSKMKLGTEGAKRIAEVLPRCTKTLTALNLSHNQELSRIMLAPGWTSRDGDNRKPWLRISDGHEQDEMPGEPEGVIVLVSALQEHLNLVSVDFSGNKIGTVQARNLVAALSQHPTVKSMCGNLGNEIELNMESKKIDLADAILLAPEIIRNENLERVVVSKKMKMETALTEANFTQGAIDIAALVVLAAFIPKCQ
jgi:Ran GTPase-activating protein (RanGAP) involved in mRNA processing and transport